MKKVEFQKTSTSLLTMLKPLTVRITTSCGKFKRCGYQAAFDCEDHNKLWKIQEMWVPGHFTCLLRNLYAGCETIVRTRHGTDWYKIGKGVVCEGCILSLCLFSLYAEYIMQMSDWMNSRLESILLREISTTSDMQMIPL